MDWIDSEVERVRDRLVVRDLVTEAEGAEVPLPLRSGGDLDETVEEALAALGQSLSPFERRVVGGGSFHEGDSDDEFGSGEEEGDVPDELL
jgi:hypothetical protein